MLTLNDVDNVLRVEGSRAGQAEDDDQGGEREKHLYVWEKWEMTFNILTVNNHRLFL